MTIGSKVADWLQDRRWRSKGIVMDPGGAGAAQVQQQVAAGVAASAGRPQLLLPPGVQPTEQLIGAALQGAGGADVSVVALDGSVESVWGVDASGMAFEKARSTKPVSERFNPSEPLGVQFDPMTVATTYAGVAPTEDHHGTRGLTYNLLNSVARTPFCAGPYNTRLNQLGEVCGFGRPRYELGSAIVLRDPKQKMTRAAEKKAAEIAKIFEAPGGKHWRGNFEDFTKAVMRDSLIYDQMTWQNLESKASRFGSSKQRLWTGAPVGMIPMDATTIRRASMDSKTIDRGLWPAEGEVYVQWLSQEQRIVGQFEADRLTFGVRRKRSSIFALGYGFPELEEALSVVTDLLNASTYKSVKFTNGADAAGIIAVHSGMSPNMFKAFRRDFIAGLKGPRNAHSLPIVQLNPDKKEKIENITLTQTDQSQQIGEHISWLVKILMALIGMDPAEIGIHYGQEGVKSSMQSGGPEQRIVYSKERGLRPLYRFYEWMLNEYFLWKIDPEFRFQITGVGAMGQKEQLDLEVSELKAFKTINETRANHDLKALDSPYADMILDASYMQNAGMMLQQGDEGDGMGGGPGGAGGEGPPGAFPGPDEGGPEGGDEGFGDDVDMNNVDNWTQALADRTEKSFSEGRWGNVVPMGSHLQKAKMRKGTRRAWRQHGRKAYVVEVG